MQPILDTLKTLYDTREAELERWLAQARAEAGPYFYTSVDLRHSGLRLAPVDTNLYPAGFNNLSKNAELRAAVQIRRYLDEHFPRAERVLIVPENHTRNLAYLDNLARLLTLFREAGMEAELGSLTAEGEVIRLQSESGTELTEYPLTREGDTLRTKHGFTPDIVVLNNDFTAGPAPLLENLRQPLVPPMHRGWYVRRKSVHFAAYAEVARQFAAAFGLDPWLFAAHFRACGAIDFKARQGIDCLAREVDGLLADIRIKHMEYGVVEDPYVFVKADSGTYGMGIMTVRDGSEMLEMNKKMRNKMQVIKEGAQVSEVIIQEGIPTIDRVHGLPAEPVVYMIDGVPIGGMYRVNDHRDAFSNLNAAGMKFTGMCDESETLRECAREPVEECHFRSFGLIAVLAALAAGREEYARD